MQSGAFVRKLDGCPRCNKHVWDDSDQSKTCPIPGCGGSRYDENGRPFEQVLHFPLKPRLEALLRCEAFCAAATYDSWRKRDPLQKFVSGLCENHDGNEVEV